MNIYEKLMQIQVDLKAPKNQFNNFGKYKYRNLEDILEALKPLLSKYTAVINITDEIVLIGERYYVKATATIINAEQGVQEISSTAYAREDESKKGMDLSQLSGSTSSYARKYALNGLFAIDDTKDSDTANTNAKEDTGAYEVNVPSKGITEPQVKRLYAIAGDKNIKADVVKEQVFKVFKKEVSDLTRAEYDKVV